MTRIRSAASIFAAIVFAGLHGAALAQAVAGSAAVLEVQRLAPQLLSFAGTPSNFASLVNGLALGTPVTLITQLPDGRLQTASFTPAAAFNSTDIARALELARQDLITRGIGTPTAEQIGVSLVGGSLPTPTGATTVAGVLSQGTAAAIPSATAGGSAGVVAEQPRVTVSTTAPGGAGISLPQRFTSDSPSIGTSNSPIPPTRATLTQALPDAATALEVQRLAPQLVSFAGTPSNFASLVNGLALGTPVTLTTQLPDGRLQTATFTPPGAFNTVDIARALELARQDLITRGIATPTAEQIAVSLVGGSLTTPLGATPIAGVMSQATPSAIVPERSRVTVTTSPTASIAPITDAPVLTATPSTVAPAAASPAFTSASPAASPTQRFTSDSPSIGTSNSPSPAIPGATVAAPNGAPSPAVQLQNRR